MGLTLYLTLRKQLTTVLTVVLLVFSLVTGLAIANYDLLRNAKWEIPGLPFPGPGQLDQGSSPGDLRKRPTTPPGPQALIADLNGTSEKIDAGIKYADLFWKVLKS